jgi:trk system potassium uptake protein TrkH
MNYRLVCKYLGHVSQLIAASMLFSLPWAHPAWGGGQQFEMRALLSLLGASAIGVLFGLAMYSYGRRENGTLYRKESMAIVGLTWVLASLLGSLPYLFSGTQRAPSQPMTLADAVFESASGFSGTGATVLTDVEDPNLVPRSVLFWRSETHFLGGLGIMVLFVALLGQGSAGKALMRAEMPGPSKETGQSRAQHAAWVFTCIFLGLTVTLAVLLFAEGLTPFDALCHAFGTIATGGFSTYNDSVAHFDSATIEMTIAVFMVLACTNFTLLYLLLLWRPRHLLADVEFRCYIAVLGAATTFAMVFGMRYGDFASLAEAFRYGFFQVASILTNTGFATQNFDNWNEMGRGILFFLMFIGGCAGSTSCSMKIIRHVLFLKIIWLELEHAYRPTVVRPLRLGGQPLEDQELRKNVLVYFGLVLLIVTASWLLLDAMEPDQAWSELGHQRHEKLMDCASGVAATLNGVGPGLGVIGAVENYAHFQPASKILFVLLMLAGRLELFVILVLFLPGFWRNR